MTLEFQLCVSWDNLDDIERRSFLHCKKRIHGLSFTPCSPTSLCDNAVQIIGQILENRQIDLILFKGGQLEMDLADKLGIEFRNLEDFGVPRFPGGIHDPAAEVHFFRKQFLEIVGGV